MGLDASTTNHPGEGGPGSSVDGNASVAGRHGRRHAGRSGLVALSLYVAKTNREDDARLMTDASAEGLVGILHCASPPRTRDACSPTACAAAAELHASSAAVFTRTAQASVSSPWMAHDWTGRSPREQSTAGITIAPHSWRIVESAAPVADEGSMIGARRRHGGRRHADTTYRAAAVDDGGDGCCAGRVGADRASISSRRQHHRPDRDDGPMSASRAAIERVAVAAFAILIEARSGSGKSSWPRRSTVPASDGRRRVLHAQLRRAPRRSYRGGAVRADARRV